MTPSERALWGRAGAAVSRSRHSPRDLTARAREAFLNKFLTEAQTMWPDLPRPELERRANELRKAHFARLAAKSVRARANRGGR